MSDNTRQNISETFGRYTGPSSDSNNQSVNGPKNITSDMWTPISTGESFEKQKEEKVFVNRAEEIKSEPHAKAVSERPAADKNRATRNAAKKSTQSASARTPKGKPVANKLIKKLLSDKKDTSQQQRQKQQRRQQELKKERAEYESQLKEGKSHNEISKKRAEIKSKKRRIRNIATVVVFFVFVAAFAGVYIYAKGAPIVNIVVEGDSIYSNTEISQAAGVGVGVNMFSLKEKTINKNVTAALPYIHSVEIDRDLPDTLIIKVTPTTEKYLIVNDTEYICVDEHMKILSLKKKKLKDGFFRVYGFEQQTVQTGISYEPSEENKEKFELVKDIVQELEKNGVIKSAVINVGDMNDVKVLYNSKVMLYLGSCSQLANQINLACNVIKETVSEGQTGYIDMRYNNMAFFNEGTIYAD